MSWTPPPPPAPEPPPPSSNPQAVPPAERIHAIDVVRGAALAGVLLANLMFAFRVPASRGYLPVDPATPWVERLAEGAVQFAIQGKAITLFSILFGVGLAIQHERFARLGDPRYWLARRLLVLLAIGVAHLTLLWNGDILTEYALSGLLVLPLMRLSQRKLVAIAAALYAFYLIAPGLALLPEWPDETLMRAEYADALRIYGSGTYAEIRKYSLHEWNVFSPIYISLFTVTPALLLLGIATWRSGLLRDLASYRIPLRGLAVAGVVLGGILTAIGMGDTTTTRGMVVEYLAAGVAPLMFAVGYGAALLLAVERGVLPRVLRGLAAAGRMAFTNYLTQSLVFTTLFFGYGFGLIGRVGAATTLVGGIVAFLLQVVFSRWWLGRYRFGPLEWVWRSLTYGRAQPMRQISQ